MDMYFDKILLSHCRERALTVPKFAEGKSMFVFGEFNKNQSSSA
jgi:hypothetical protein